MDATNTIQLPTGFTGNMLAVATNTISNISPLVWTILGVLLATVVVEILIGIFRK